MMKMKLKPSLQLICAILLVWSNFESSIYCNPLAFDPTASPFIGMPQMHPLQAPMLMAPQFDPYSHMQMPGQYMFGSPLMPMPFADASRRSLPGMQRPEERSHSSRREPTDEQKALGDLPVSFIDPDEPQTISERISDSFSALGEGVKNHFRSITENFSDTIDDIKDAWKPSGDNSNKRG